MPRDGSLDYRNLINRTTVIVLFAFLISCSNVKHFNHPQSLKISEKIGNELNSLDARYGFWGGMVIDLNSRDTLLSINSQKAFTPASITKLFTVGAFELLNKELNKGYLGYSGYQPADSTIDTLIFRGSGLSLDGENKIDSLLLTGISALSDSGILSINKAILIDTPDEDEIFHPGWTMDDFTGYYASTPSFLSALSNLWEITLQRTADSVRAEIFPDSPFQPRVVVDSSEHFYYRWEFGEYQIPFLHIGFPQTEYRRKIFLPMFSPRYVWGYRLKKMLVDSGFCDDHISLKYEKVRDKNQYLHIKSFLPLARDSLYELALSYSDNFIAGQLLRGMAYADSGLYSRGAGLMVMDSLLATAGIQKGVDYLFFDGAGLSRYNWITPKATSILLNLFIEKPVLFNALAENGEKGTLEHRFGYFPENVLIRGKTGSMRGVRNYAGFIDLPNGNRYELIFLVNHFTVSSREIDKIVRRLILYIVYNRYTA